MQEQGLEQREWVAMAVQVRVHGQGLELELAQALVQVMELVQLPREVAAQVVGPASSGKGHGRPRANLTNGRRKDRPRHGTQRAHLAPVKRVES